MLTAIAVIVWRAATGEDLPEYDGKSIVIVADYVARCQTMTQECYAAVDAAFADRVRKDCLDSRPGRHAMARGALIWLNAHPRTHPLPLRAGLAQAVAAVWPRCSA